MLVLSRKLNESIVIDGRVVVHLLRIEGDHVKIGIEAPLDVPIHRFELYSEIKLSNHQALTHGRPAVLPSLPIKPLSEPVALGPLRHKE